LFIRPRGADVTVETSGCGGEAEILDDRLVSSCPSGLRIQQQIYIATSMTYVFAVLFGLAHPKNAADFEFKFSRLRQSNRPGKLRGFAQ
jgi:hypothetical protein